MFLPWFPSLLLTGWEGFTVSRTSFRDRFLTPKIGPPHYLLPTCSRPAWQPRIRPENIASDHLYFSQGAYAGKKKKLRNSYIFCRKKLLITPQLGHSHCTKTYLLDQLCLRPYSSSSQPLTNSQLTSARKPMAPPPGQPLAL